MKTYGETLHDIRNETYSTTRSGGWLGKQSRKVARRRRMDKKILHRLARRRAKRNLTVSNQD